MEWPGILRREQALSIIMKAADCGDNHWESIVGHLYDEDSDTLPSIFHVMASLGFSKEEVKEAIGGDNINFPDGTHR